MKAIVKVLGRLLGVLIMNEIITAKESLYILEPLNSEVDTDD